MQSKSVYRMCASALLIAIGVVIPMFMPQIRMEPASFTLASHVPVFLAMMLSPGMAAAVALGTTLGFQLAAFPPVIVLRAATHLVFALLGAHYLQKQPDTLTAPVKPHLFSAALAAVHAVCEVLAVSWFYAGGSMSALYYERGYLYSVILLVGVGGFIHSLVDYELALVVYKALDKQNFVARLRHT